MNEERKIETEEVDAVDTAAARPRHARVRAQARLSRRLPRRRKPRPSRRRRPGGDLQEAVVEALKSIYDPEIPVDIYELGLIYDVEISEDGDAIVTMTLTTPHCPVAGIDARARSSCACCRCPASATPRSNWSGTRRGTRRR